MSPRRRSRPVPVSEVVPGALAHAGVAERVERARAVLEWQDTVGPQIARVAQARSATADGTLFVDVISSSWMTELQFQERALLARLNRDRRSGSIRRIQWRVATPGVRTHGSEFSEREPLPQTD